MFKVVTLTPSPSKQVGLLGQRDGGTVIVLAVHPRDAR